MRTIDLEDLYRKDPQRACRLALRRTEGYGQENRLQAIDRLLGTHGTEAIHGAWQNGYWADIVAVYCNAGDAYATTVIQERGKTRYASSRFFVSSWGNLVENAAWCRRNGVE